MTDLLKDFTGHEESDEMIELGQKYDDLYELYITKKEENAKLRQALEDARYDLISFRDLLQEQGGRYEEVEETLSKISEIMWEE